LPIVK